MLKKIANSFWWYILLGATQVPSALLTAPAVSKFLWFVVGLCWALGFAAWSLEFLKESGAEVGR